MKLTDFKVLTFDCYGTLIDWESGIWTALQPLLAAGGLTLGRDAALEAFAARESAQEAATPGLLYRDLLVAVHGQLAEDWSVDSASETHARFGASVPDWPAFSDSVAALQYLKQHYKLVILSNVDRAGFAGSNERLQVDFDAVYTAEDIGSYKPTAHNFEYLLAHLKADLGLEQADILHTAQSLFHDHAPACDFGLATAWIDRRHEQDGWGATMPPPGEVRVDFHFTSMADMAAAHRAVLGS